ncbi:DUF551 domain-containing protein [Moraxella porci]|uniref:DUF551 domain-containing protein n=1 Tax=Moraxella porci TaxID=1288392 RepID=UPI002449359A|nr:DUF551 domain-containing protein [Moraxella porci]MDH2272952.1 DUF551 domain-containing protein [Moraxella porci]
MIEKLKKIIMDKINAYPPNKKNLAVRAELASIHEFIENYEYGWISVDEDIPPEGERVIRWDGYQVSVGTVESWFAKGGELCVGFEDDDVTHWMPLPQPPTRK